MAINSVTNSMTQGLVAHWPLDDGVGTTARNLASKVNGTLTSGPVWTPGRFAVHPVFNGTSSYIEAADTGLPTGSSPRTISFWLRPDSSAVKSVLGYGSTGFGNMMDFLVYSGAINIHWSGNSATEMSGLTYSIGVWNHYAYTYNGSVLTGYLNGVPKNSVSATLNTVSSGSIFIGSGVFPTYKFAACSLADVKVFNRALTANEIAALFANSVYPRIWSKRLAAFLGGSTSLPDGPASTNLFRMAKWRV